MAVVTMSVNTKTREVAVVVDGTLVPAIECRLAKQIFGGELDISLSYVVEVESGNGLVERRMFFLPEESESLASKVVDMTKDNDIQKDVDKIFDRSIE